MTTIQQQRIIGITLLFSLILGVAWLLIDSAQESDAIIKLETSPNVVLEPSYVEFSESYPVESMIDLEGVNESVHDSLDEGSVDTLAVKTEIVPAPSAIDTAKVTWVIQLASFSVKENATALSSQVKSMGYNPIIQTSASSNGQIYRVRLEPIIDKNRANRIASELNTKLKLSTQILQE